MLALFTAMLELPAAVPAVLALLAVVSVYWSVQRLFARSTRWSRLLGESSAARAVVAVTAGEVAGLGAAFSALLVVLVVVVPAGEPHIRKCWGRVGAEVRNFPAAHVELTEPIRRGLVPVASFAVTAVLVPLAALGAGLVALVLVLALVVLYVAVVVRAFQRAEGLVATEGRLVTEITRLAPEFAVYFASSVGAGYQIGMWLPYFARIGRPFIVVTRVHSTLREIAEVMRRVGVEAPIIYRPTLTSLEDVIVPSMRAAFYVNNAVRNTHFIERRELVHVWLNHGDSEKPACYNPVHAIYDLIFVAGQAGIDRYARHGVHIPAEKFRVVGRPQVETITTARRRGGPQPTVLYAPTWQGPYADTRFFSLPQGLAIVERLLADGARVLFRPHPLNYNYPDCVGLIRKINRRLAEDREQTGREHLWGAAAETELTIEQCFNASDAMIADVSAVVSDYLQSTKPFAIAAIGRTPEQLVDRRAGGPGGVRAARGPGQPGRRGHRPAAPRSAGRGPRADPHLLPVRPAGRRLRRGVPGRGPPGHRPP